MGACAASGVDGVIGLAGSGNAGRTDELAGDASFTLAELFAAMPEASGKPMTYQNMTPKEFRAAALKADAPETIARILLDSGATSSTGDRPAWCRAV